MARKSTKRIFIGLILLTLLLSSWPPHHVTVTTTEGDSLCQKFRSLFALLYHPPTQTQTKEIQRPAGETISRPPLPPNRCHHNLWNGRLLLGLIFAILLPINYWRVPLKTFTISFRPSFHCRPHSTFNMVTEQEIRNSSLLSYLTPTHRSFPFRSVIIIIIRRRRIK